MIFTKIFLWLLGAAVVWWVSGFDPHLTGENLRRDYLRRVARCLATAALLGFLFAPDAIRIGYAFIPLLLIVPPSIGILWAGCLGAFFARGFNRLVYAEDRRPFDPGEGSRNVDRVADLLRRGRQDEAVRLCAELKESGCADMAVLETMLARAGITQETPKGSPPLVEAGRLRKEGKFNEAETILRSLLAENPANFDAALMLIRIYAHDLHSITRASEVLRVLEKQPHVSAEHIEYARRSITESGRKEDREPAMLLPESVDELLAGGHIGTAIEVLERKLHETPGDFASWLKLAEAHGLYAGNVHRAEKIVRKIESNPAFNPEQVAAAKARLAEWKG